MDTAAPKRLASGIAGLDEMLHGGVMAGSVTLLQGAPGTGKTTAGIQFLYEGATRCHEPGLLVTFEQFPVSLYRDATGHGWDLRRLEQEGSLRVVFTSPQVFLSSLQSPTSPISSAIREMGIQRAVIDSVTHLRSLAQAAVELRAQYNYLVNGLRREGITSLLLSEEAGPDLVRSDSGRLAYVVDCVVLLRFVEIDSIMQRAVAVLKARGTDHDKAIRRFEIKQEGLVVTEPFSGRQGLLSGLPRRTG
jgi:circadian clock protein KaiC